jgi:hypothetical protein
MAARAISNLARILGHSANDLRGATTSPSTGGKIEINPNTPVGDVAVRSLQITKPDGGVVVAVWRETLFWDRAKGTPLEAPSVRADVSFGRDCASIRTYDTLQSSEPIAVTGGSSASLMVGDYVRLMECAR